MEREIIVLAKSSKHGEFCIAGIDINTGDWIRPISNNLLNEGSVPLEDIKYEDGTEVQILDKVKIHLLSHEPTRSQPENYKYDSRYYWEKIGTSTISDVIKLREYDGVEEVFYNSRKDVMESELNGGSSLLLLKVKNPCIFIKTFDKQKIQFNFEYNNIKYNYFKISDPEIKKHYSSYSDGNYSIGEYADVIFSLTDKYAKTDKYYKMVAQIFKY